MAGGFKMALVADVSGFLKGTKDVETALGKVSGSLDEMAKDAQTAGAKAEGAVEGVATQAKTTATGVGTATDKMERSFKDTFDAVKTKAKDTGDTVDREMHAGTGKATEAVGEFKNEAAQNFSEVASSFSGDMTQAADGVQGVLGGLASSIPGPVGLISGLLAGIGGAMLQSFMTSSAASKQAISDMYDDMLASGLDYLSAEYQQAEISKIVKDEAGAITKLADAQDLAKGSGQELSTVLAALAGDAGEQGRVTEAFTEKIAGFQQAVDNARAAGTLTTDMYDRYEAKINDVRRDQGHWNDLLATTTGSLDAAQAKVGASRDAMDKLTGAFDRTTDSAGRVSQGIAGIPGNVDVTVNADTSDAESKLGGLKALIDSFDNPTVVARVGRNVARATGGSVVAGGSYIVGENEPELFVPGQSGTVLNQQQILGALSRPSINLDLTPKIPASADSHSRGVTIEIGNITTYDHETLLHEMERRLSWQFMSRGI